MRWGPSGTAGVHVVDRATSSRCVLAYGWRRSRVPATSPGSLVGNPPSRWGAPGEDLAALVPGACKREDRGVPPMTVTHRTQSSRRPARHAAAGAAPSERVAPL